MAKKKSNFPAGWDEARVQAVLQHYEGQSEDEAVAEDEAAFRARGQTVMIVPKRLVPEITRLISREKTVALRKRPNNTLQPPSRARRKSKSQRNPRAARG